jgi:hypothetical protein
MRNREEKREQDTQGRRKCGVVKEAKSQKAEACVRTASLHGFFLIFLPATPASIERALCYNPFFFLSKGWTIVARRI